jgi:hypothetical protein
MNQFVCKSEVYLQRCRGVLRTTPIPFFLGSLLLFAAAAAKKKIQ